MFLLLFGETLAAFLGFLVTVFFVFHIWLILKAMTTIEFCEKSMKRAGYDTSAYDRGICGNIRAVLGDNPFFWFVPFCSAPSGDGLSYFAEDTKLITDIRSEPSGRKFKGVSERSSSRTLVHRAPGTGSAPGSGESWQGDDEDDDSETGGDIGGNGGHKASYV